MSQASSPHQVARSLTGTIRAGARIIAPSKARAGDCVRAAASLRRCYDQMRIKRASPQRDLFRVLIPAHAPYVNSELELSVRTLRGSDGKKAGGLPSGRPRMRFSVHTGLEDFERSLAFLGQSKTWRSNYD